LSAPVVDSDDVPPDVEGVLPGLFVSALAAGLSDVSLLPVLDDGLSESGGVIPFRA
jgi:hypothetical protein